MWSASQQSMIETSRRIADLHKATVEEFDIAPTRCLKDLLKQLMVEGPIELQGSQ